MAKRLTESERRARRIKARATIAAKAAAMAADPVRKAIFDADMTRALADKEGAR